MSVIIVHRRNQGIDLSCAKCPATAHLDSPSVEDSERDIRAFEDEHHHSVNGGTTATSEVTVD